MTVSTRWLLFVADVVQVLTVLWERAWPSNMAGPSMISVIVLSPVTALPSS